MRQHPIIGLYADTQTSFARNYPYPISAPQPKKHGERWALVGAIVFALAAVAAVIFSR